MQEKDEEHPQAQRPCHITDCRCCVSCSLHVTASATCQQYWWERFPADGGAATTVYMFTFTDPAPANRDLLGDMVHHFNSVLGAYLGKQSLGQKVLVLWCAARKEQEAPHTHARAAPTPCLVA